MRVFVVGGYVRDMIIGVLSKDKDYVVVGSSPCQMKDNGFTQVGADFPVFLHPETGEDYALARRERKTGSGYLGFDTEFDTDVSLEEDLIRRDLTVNSIAYDEENKEFIDPFNGRMDIEHKILRHTSEKFEEDPVRVLRLARFKARFGPEWKVAQETRELIYSMSKKGVLSELQPDRIWKELSRAILEPYPRLFFDTLLECDALHSVFPEIYKLKTALEAHRWHPEGDAYEHTMLVLNQSVKYGISQDEKLKIRMNALLHDIGKGITPRDRLPKHHGHDVKGVDIVEQFCEKNGFPKQIKNISKKICRYHMYMHKLTELKSKTIVKMFDDLKVSNNPDMCEYMYYIGLCDSNGRLGYENIDFSNDNEKIFELYEGYASVIFADVFPNGETNGEKIKQEIYKERINRIEEVKKTF